MVYLEQQSIYLSQFIDSPIAPLLKEILQKESGKLSDDIHNAGDLALNLLISVKSKDRDQAIRYYTIFSKRQPTRESHWIYDNYVLFSIVCAVRKFGLDIQWIRNVIDISYAGSDPINKKIKDTLKSILSGNYNSNGDFHQISIVYQYIAADEHYDNETINKMFHYLWLKTFPFFEDDFLNILSFKAIEIAFLKKALLTDVEFYYLNEFIPDFNSRADFIAKVLARLLIVGFIFSVFFLLWNLNNNEIQYPTAVKVVLFFSTFSGIGVLAVWGWKSNLAKIFRIFINKVFKYRVF